MRQAFVLAIDIGSSSTRSALFDTRARCLEPSRASRNYGLDYTADGGAELDPQVLLRAARHCVSETRRHTAKTPLLAVSGSAFWHSLMGVNAKGVPLTPIFTWADARSTSDAVQLRRELREQSILDRTGCMLRAPFWPAKLRWLQRTRRALFRRVDRWVSPGAWVFEQLFGARGTSQSMASGTGLYNLEQRSWDEELCGVCGVPLEKLGQLVDQPRSDVEVFGPIGDGAASNIGSGADAPDKIAINIGTSAAVRMILPRNSMPARRIPLGLFRYVVDEERVVAGGAVSNGGSLRQWFLRELRLDSAEAFSRDAAADDELSVLPFWVQERAPSWPENLRGTILGLTPATSAVTIARATQTSVFYRLAAILEQLEAATGRASEVIVSGGILHSPDSPRILADALGRDIRIATEMESSLRGAAIVALERLGYSIPPLRRGRLVKQRLQLATKHRARREEQEQLERRLATG